MRTNLFVLGLFLGLAVLVTWPLVLHLNSLIIDRYDSLLITWIDNWVIHSLLAGPVGWRNVLNANIFYPYQNVLAFSDYHFVSALFALPFTLLFHEPLIAFNINVILGLTLTGYTAYLLAKFLTKQISISVFAGILLSFSTIHLNYLAHPQIFHLWLIVLPLFFLFQSKFKLFTLLFFLAVLNSPLNLYLLLFLIVVYLLVFPKGRRKVLMATSLAAILSAPFLVPYFLVSRQFHYTRPITDAINFSLQFPDLANISIFSRLSNLVPQAWGTPAYFGGVFLVLIFITILNMFHHPSGNKLISFWMWAAELAFVLSLGPALHIFRHTIHLGPIRALPLPYALLYYLVPGFAGFRTPSRWIVITALSFTMAIAIYFAKRINIFYLILLTLLVLLEVNLPFKYFSVPAVKQFPPEQVWLKDHYVGAPIVQFPIYGWFDGDKVGIETLQEYYSTNHWHPMYNGYSGFSPIEWENRVKWLQKNFPSSESISWVKAEKIKLIIVPKFWEQNVAQFSQVKLVQSFPNASVFEVM